MRGPALLTALLGAVIGAVASFVLVRRARQPVAPPSDEGDRASRLTDAGRRLSEVAHELNNPLTAILAFSQDLLQADPSSEQREALLVIQQQARRSRKLVHGLLEEVRATPPDSPKVDPNALVARIVPIFQRDAERNGLKFNVVTDQSLPPLEGDVGGLEQVLTNLLQNGFQATPRGGRVTLITRIRGRLLEFVIEDSGPGIPPENLSRIFDPFFTSKSPGEGTGLGLSVSQTIVRRHRGTLVAENIPPWEGGGARFVVSLPFVDRRQKDREVTAEEESPKHRRILLIEDDDAVRLSMRRFLERAGWAVDEATDGRSGLELARQNRWDVIICDLQLPELSGIELYSRLAGVDPKQAARLVMVSGDCSSPDVVEFRNRTGAVILEKPFELRTFGEAVERAASDGPGEPA